MMCTCNVNKSLKLKHAYSISKSLLAKDTFVNMIKGNRPTPEISYTIVREACSMAVDIALKSWQCLLDNKSARCYTH